MTYQIADRRFMRAIRGWVITLAAPDDGQPVIPPLRGLVVDQSGRKFRPIVPVGLPPSAMPGLVFLQADDRNYERGPSSDSLSDA